MRRSLRHASSGSGVIRASGGARSPVFGGGGESTLAAEETSGADEEEKAPIGCFSEAAGKRARPAARRRPAAELC